MSGAAVVIELGVDRVATDLLPTVTTATTQAYYVVPQSLLANVFEVTVPASCVPLAMIAATDCAVEDVVMYA